MKPIVISPFGTMANGEQVMQYCLENNIGSKVTILSLGGIIQSLYLPNREGQHDDVVLGFDNVAQYENESPYFGCIVGRFANRIANGEFELEGKKYQLAKNNGPNNLHGGPQGFESRLWQVEVINDGHITMSLVSPDGDQGFPGTMVVTVDYKFSEDNQLMVRYHATCDQQSIVNLTQHSYFNLAGHNQSDVLAHQLQLKASHITEVNEHLIPTGKLRPVKDTPFDFMSFKPLARDIDADDDQIRLGGGYDHNWVFDTTGQPFSAPLAQLFDEHSGRAMSVYTDQPGVQVYTANFLDDLKGKKNAQYKPRQAVCLETQHFPDAINQPEFPSVVISPNKPFTTTTIFAFSIS
ncbi:aldose epimerase family protein [Thalassotalea agarivorans]|uniref:Aldose 1-epimerase n=1 Tax=Thalassotalea agarivorans TaxID=349064 RepID=A0A1I0BWJ4_THASX|nr:aldose epimerase family protein [Thalassotalea agarivorans]SET11349.1 aldose 1-epimerase [Thalassotalea agarivorans]